VYAVAGDTPARPATVRTVTASGPTAFSSSAAAVSSFSTVSACRAFSSCRGKVDT
jgi:hypothetical protein